MTPGLVLSTFRRTGLSQSYALFPNSLAQAAQTVDSTVSEVDRRTQGVTGLIINSIVFTYSARGMVKPVVEAITRPISGFTAKVLSESYGVPVELIYEFGIAVLAIKQHEMPSYTPDIKREMHSDQEVGEASKRESQDQDPQGYVAERSFAHTREARAVRLGEKAADIAIVVLTSRIAKKVFERRGGSKEGSEKLGIAVAFLSPMVIYKLKGPIQSLAISILRPEASATPSDNWVLWAKSFFKTPV